MEGDCTERLHKCTWACAHTHCLIHIRRTVEVDFWESRQTHKHTHTLPGVATAAFFPLGIHCQSFKMRATLPPFSLSPSLSELALRALRYFHLGLHQWESEWLRESELGKVIRLVRTGSSAKQRRWLRRRGRVSPGALSATLFPSRAYLRHANVTVTDPEVRLRHSFPKRVLLHAATLTSH